MPFKFPRRILLLLPLSIIPLLQHSQLHALLGHHNDWAKDDEFKTHATLQARTILNGDNEMSLKGDKEPLHTAFDLLNPHWPNEVPKAGSDC